MTTACLVGRRLLDTMISFFSWSYFPLGSLEVNSSLTPLFLIQSSSRAMSDTAKTSKNQACSSLVGRRRPEVRVRENRLQTLAFQTAASNFVPMGSSRHCFLTRLVDFFLFAVSEATCDISESSGFTPNVSSTDSTHHLWIDFVNARLSVPVP